MANAVAEIRMHEAILSSLRLWNVQKQDAEIACAQGDCERIDHVSGVFDALKRCINSHKELKTSMRSGLGGVGGDDIAKFAFHFGELSEKLREALDASWKIAPAIGGRQSEYCSLLKTLEECWNQIEEITEVWCSSADPETRKEILERVEAAREECSDRNIPDWRDFLASV